MCILFSVFYGEQGKLSDQVFASFETWLKNASPQFGGRLQFLKREDEIIGFRFYSDNMALRRHGEITDNGISVHYITEVYTSNPFKIEPIPDLKMVQTADGKVKFVKDNLNLKNDFWAGYIDRILEHKNNALKPITA